MSKNKAKTKAKKDVIETPWHLSMRKLKKNKLAMVGLIFLIVMILFCLIGPLFSPYRDITEVDILNAKQPPSSVHWLGTDTSGRDIMTRLMLGGRISLMVGLIATAVEIFVGAFLGCVSGYYGGAVDTVIMRIVDVVLSLPTMPILIMISAIFSDLHVDTGSRIYFLMLILACLGWAGICRFFRGQVLTVREMDYMAATEAMGLHDMRKIFKHIMPNVFPLIIVTATLSVGDTILMESTLSYLGVGVLPPYASWGNMVQEGSNMIDFTLHPWMWMPAGFCILATVLCINLFGDGLRDALDPRMVSGK
ncbi:MAG: ABC transporter permease [Oscillospiraceae bacterium]|jgi:peptide/nickel transport system permease protein|nr:ABC transporter permease [Oscillospiraceae bacterium]MDD3261899.1 ABC transporter permease [Oscillospiraceae bacterium]